MRKLDEAEQDYARFPRKMAAMHHTEGYYYENRNPYDKDTAEWKEYEGAFFNLTMRRGHNGL